MDEQRRKKLLRHVKAFRGLVKMVDNLVAERHHSVSDEAFAQVRAGVDDAVKDLSDVIPSFSDAAMQGEASWDEGSKEYKPAPIRGFLQRAIAACEAELEEAIPAEVVGPTLDFSFMHDKRLRLIVERDYPELLVAFTASCKKSCLMLAGSIIESVLLDLALRDVAMATKTSAAPKSPDPMRWSLDELINVAVELQPTLAPVQAMSHGVRQYRNLVHPAAEIRSSLKVEIEEAKVAITLISILHRELQ
ncbi:MAG TPA: hypothetical protein VNN25_10015 [Thermoanaerobaculia bacterium]|nr:hypothetical protein [Thermoanaerobaculia bacterium]